VERDAAGVLYLADAGRVVMVIDEAADVPEDAPLCPKGLFSHLLVLLHGRS
jgi:hypothetical protein